MRKLRLLVACEYSGSVRDAFSLLGWDAWSCDLVPSETLGNHFIGDVSLHLGKGWDLLIGHPPCTRICNSGVRWLEERNLYLELTMACQFFKRLLNAPVPHVCIENPIPHKHAMNLIQVPYTQQIQPWMFGDRESKGTCLWLKNLPPLEPTNVVNQSTADYWAGEQNQTIHKMRPSKTRSKERSRTFPGVAKAMAEQWTRFITHSLAK